jgi:Domain of unknown function (DUF4167)
MRQGQQNRRGRGRSSNSNQGRKGQNPLTRSFESTGPDVKIRGTPAHVAEKYMALARDATSSGDPVLAENYFQHAEHYNRIIMTFREQQMGQGSDSPNGSAPRPRPAAYGDASASGDDAADEDGENTGSDALPQGGNHVRGQEPQPRSFDGPRYDDRPQRSAHEQRPRQSRDRNGGGEGRGYSSDRGERAQSAAEGETDAAPQRARRAERGVPQHEQPEFLRRPVRRPRRESAAAPEAASSTVDEAEQD